MLYIDLQNTLIVKAAQAANIAGNYTPPVDFAEEMPRFIEYGENRIYRELKLLATRAQNTACVTTEGSRQVSLVPITNLSLTVEGFAVITPQGVSNPQQGTRLQYEAASLDTIDMLFPVENTPVPPGSAFQRWWAMRDAQTIVIGPTPDNTYACEITGLFQPAPISAASPTTYLSTVYPDLLVAACMISVCAYLRDYGQMSDDPKIAVSWEQQFSELVEGAEMEEMRRRMAGTGWNQNAQAPLAQKAA